MAKKGLVGELGLVLELDLVPCHVVLHCVLQDHDFEHFYGLGVGEFALGDKGTYMDTQGMDTLIGELADIREQFVPEVPDSSSDFILVPVASRESQGIF